MAALLVPASPAPVSAAPAGAVAVAPAPGSSLVPGGAYFLVRGAAGASLHQSVVLTNLSTAAVSAAVEGVDAVSVAGSQAVYGTPDQAATGAGAWIAADRNPVALGAGRTAAVGFTVSVPAGVRAGEYLAGISVSTSSAPKTPVRTGGLGVAVDTQIQHVLAVEIEVGGAPATPSLEVTRTGFADAGRGPTLVVQVTNVGNGIAHGTVDVSVPAAELQTQLPAGTLLPAAVVEYRVPWPVGRAQGPDPVSVTLRYGSRAQTWTGRIGVSRTARGSRTAHPAAAASSGGPSVGVVILGAGLGAGIVGGALVLLARRRPARSSRPRRRAADHH